MFGARSLFYRCNLALMLLLGISVIAMPQAFSQSRKKTAEPPIVAATNPFNQLPGPVATQIAFNTEGETSSLVIDMSHTLKARVGAMQGPDRLVLDFDGLRIHASQLRMMSRDDRVQSIRFGAFMRGQARILIELSKPMLVEDQRFIDLPEGGNRLIIRFKSATAADFAALAAQKSDPIITGTTPTKVSDVQTENELPLVVLDPGHGGIDSGATGPTGELEKTIVLAFAHSLKARLEASGKARVRMTRSDDSFVSLSERVKFTRQAKAALFVSLHADALPDEGDVRGASIYTLSDKATDERSQRLADKENKADLAAGVESPEDQDEVADILMGLARREARIFSVQFARTLAATLPRATRMHRVALRGAGFKVLRSGDVPSVLLELGYLTTVEDAKLMQSEDWRKNTADAAGEAIERFLAEKLRQEKQGQEKPGRDGK